MAYFPEHPAVIQGLGVYTNTLPDPFQRKRYRWIWPRDKPSRKGHWGRLKDVLTNQGPDVFVSSDHNRPLRRRWTNRPWLDEDDNALDLTTESPFWVKRWRRPGVAYDFRTRKYKKDRPQVFEQWLFGAGANPVGDPLTWTDARWEGPSFGKHMPNAYRCRHGDWYKFYAI